MRKKDRPLERTTSYHFEPQILLHKRNGLRVAAYCRVSTLQEDQDMSFETQCGYYEKLLANDPNMTLVGVYGDHGLSGLRAASRPEFQRMITDALDGKIDRIYVKSVSRFSRNMSECLEYIRLLKQHGVIVYFEKEHAATDDEKLEMILNVYASIAQNDSCSLSSSIRWAHEKRAEQGDPVRAAIYGYRRCPTVPGQPADWVIDEKEATRVRVAFDMVDNGHTYTEIIDKLNEMEQADGTSVVWIQSRVRAMLLHEAYVGDLLVNKYCCVDYLTRHCVRNNGLRSKYYIEEHHDPIVTREQFERVGKLRKAGVPHSQKSEKTRLARCAEIWRQFENEKSNNE